MKQKTKVATPTAVRIPAAKKRKLQEVAQRRGVTLTDLLIEGAEMLADFDDDFLKQINAAAESNRLPVTTVLVNLLLAYTARESATAEVFGVSDIFQAAFRHDENGLVTGNALSAAVYAESREAAMNLLRRIRHSAENGADIKISRPEAAMLASAIASARI
jgi:hypothetical protein